MNEIFKQRDKIGRDESLRIIKKLREKGQSRQIAKLPKIKKKTGPEKQNELPNCPSI